MLRATYTLVQATVGVGTVIIPYIGVAYTGGGGYQYLLLICFVFLYVYSTLVLAIGIYSQCSSLAGSRKIAP